MSDLPNNSYVNGFIVIGVWEGGTQLPFYYWGDQRPGADYYEEHIAIVPEGERGYNVDLEAWKYDDAYEPIQKVYRRGMLTA